MSARDLGEDKMQKSLSTQTDQKKNLNTLRSKTFFEPSFRETQKENMQRMTRTKIKTEESF